MIFRKTILSVFIWFALVAFGVASPEIIRSLIDPVKLDSLSGDRAANGRLRKIGYWLEMERRQGRDPATSIDIAQKSLGYAGTARAVATKESLLRNLTILQRLGCTDEAGMEKMRRGRAPTITKGPYAGDIASVDHIIPRSIAPGLDEKLYNLEFMPGRMNSGKGANIGQRQRHLATQWHQQGLMEYEEYQRVMEGSGKLDQPGVQ